MNPMVVTMRRLLPLILLLLTSALSRAVVQELEIPPHMDSVNVSWNEDAQTGHMATIRWSEQLPEPDGIKVNRYRVWRSLFPDTGFKLRSGTSKGVTVFVDKTVVSGKVYYYYITALSTTGVESGASVTVAVSIP